MTLPEQTRTVKLIVAEQFGITIEDIDSRKRQDCIAFPRQVAMFFVHKYLRLSQRQVGALFNREHTDVCHAAQRVLERCKVYHPEQRSVDAVHDKLQEAGL